MKSDIFLIQVGHNGSPLTKQAIEKKYADGAILSPADYKPDENKDLSKNIRAKDGIVLFDNHWYMPRSKRPKLSEYDYFKNFGGEGYDTTNFEKEKIRNEFCDEIIKIQDDLSVDAYISPAVYINTFSKTKIQNYMDLSRSFLKCVKKNGRKIPSLISVPICNKVLIDVDHRKDILNYLTSLDCDGFYISYVVEEGEGYPLTRPADVISLLNFVFSLKQNDYYVLMGHSHHISYLLLCAGIDGFATGHYKNLRSFDINRWDIEESGGRTPAINYFSTHLLNDLRVESDLEMLYQYQIDLKTVKSGSPFEENLFSQSPSLALTTWKHRKSWDHYLWCCNELLERQKNKSLLERVSNLESHIKNAEDLYNKYDEIGLLTQPDEKIYASWKSALKILKNMIQQNK